MEVIEKGIRSVQNSTPKFREKFLEILLDILYGKKTTEDFDAKILADPKERQKLVQQTNFLKDPSVTSLATSLVTLNSFDLCNPFSFLITQALPDGNPLKESFLKLDGLARTWQSISSGNFLGGGGTVSFKTTLPIDNAITFTGNQKISFPVAITDRNIGSIDLNDNVTIFQEDDEEFKNYSLIGEVIGASFPNLRTKPFGTKTGISGEILTANPNSPQQKVIEISVVRASVSRPPFLKDNDGNEILDDRGNPTPKEFRSLRLEVQKDPNPTQEVLSEGLIEISKAIDEVGLEDIIETIEGLPPYFPNMDDLKRTTQKLIKFQRIMGPILANASNTALVGGAILQNRLTFAEAREASEIVREFDQAIRPFFKGGDRVVQGYFDTVQDLNSFFRDVIPYDFLAKFVKFVVKLAKIVNSIVIFLLSILKLINTIIKAITGVLKIVNVVLKVIQKLILLLPALILTVGIIETFTRFLADAIAGIDRAIKFLENISNYLDQVVLYLTLIQQGLEVIIREGTLLAAKLESCDAVKDTGLGLQMTAAVEELRGTLKALTIVTPDGDGFYNDDPTLPGRGFKPEDTFGSQTYISTTDGDLVFISDTVIGFDSQGNLIFYAELESLSTGVQFNNTLGQGFRNFLNENFRFYTFDKFRNQQPLLLEGDRLAHEAKTGRIREVDPEDIFGNFSEIFLGYTLKIQEEKPVDENSQVAIRRRGVALDNNEFLVASTKLTFATDLNTIVQELKFILKKKVEEGLIGVGTLDSTPNQISDDDAITVAESIGANPLGINNLKAENNNKLASDLPVKNNKEELQTRTGNKPFTSKVSPPSSNLVNNGGSNREKIDVSPLVQNALSEFIDDNPGLKKVSQTVARIDRLDKLQLSQLQRIPNGNNLTTEEKIQKSKENILSNMDPNPDKIEEVSIKTQNWYEGIKGKAETDFEQLSLVSGGDESDFDKYFDKIVKEELKNWTRLLLNSGYTETEVEFGANIDEVRDNYRFEIEEDGNIIVKKRTGFNS
tara:strand:- start:3763 stop:6792 length:3030 start_codon:yes stop_codon:yes gene_type:complete